MRSLYVWYKLYILQLTGLLKFNVINVVYCYAILIFTNYNVQFGYLIYNFTI